MSQKSSITDSPWFWIYLFCTAGLLGLVVIGPRFDARQLMEERSYQGRQRGLQQAAGQDPDLPVSTREARRITLRPLYLVLGAVLIGAWIQLWWKHFRGGKFPPQPEASKST
jgi:hypothetical protein